MAQENVVTVQIYSQTYHLSSDEQDPEYIRRAAEYLDGKMRAAAAAAGSRSPLDIAILAALDIAEEVLAARRQKDSLLDDADRRISSVTRRLEEEGGSAPLPGSRF
jgi:cell division protein ZapA